jgi:eukaryotic-like serine/threonine-protein kinase
LDLPGPERWRRLDELLAGALARPAGERGAYLRQATGGDPALLREIGSLLEGVAEAEAELGESMAEAAPDLLASLGAQPALPSPEDLLGREVGPYRILDEIGRGGMGVVYRAVDRRLDRTVALKFLPPGRTTPEASSIPPFYEARIASATEHPNVASVYEVGRTADGFTYLVLPHYEGETLKARIARGPIPPEEALGLVRQMAEGLRAVHRKGVIHRDVKPANIMVTSDGWVKILDFGVATHKGMEDPGGTVPAGTLGYMSPERLRGEEVDVRADVWALGVVLHEMLTGCRPFDGPDPAAVTKAILEGEERLAWDPDPRIPPPLRPVLDRALARNRDRRYPDLDRFLQELPVPEGTGERARGSPPRSRRTRAAVMAAAVGGAVLLGGALGLLQGPGGGSALGGLWSSGPPPRSLAVLSFSEAEEEGGYLGAGLADEVLDVLSGISGLQVVSGTSSLRYGASGLRPAEIAEELGVSHIVEGSVRQEGERIRISVRLVDARRDRTLWSQTYDRDRSELFLMQGQIARGVAGALGASLTPPEMERLEAPPTASPAAYDLLLQATQYLRRYRREDNEVAIQLLHRAIDADPGFALAHARLGTARALKVFQYGDPHEWADSALASARRAVELDPEAGEIHHAMALALLAKERYREALASSQRARELAPGYWAATNLLGVVNWRLGEYDEALQWYRVSLPLDPVGHPNTLSTISGVYAFLGLFDEARDAVEQALALQPDLPLAHLNAILLHLVEGEYGRAVEQGRLLLVTSPGNARAWATAGTAYQFAGNVPGARAHLGRAYEISPSSFDLLWRSVRILLAHTLLAEGEVERAEALLDDFTRFALEQIEGGNEGPFLPYNLAAVHALRGDPGGALEWLEEAVRLGRKEYLFLSRDPLFVSLHRDPRFQRLVERNRAEMARQRDRVLVEGMEEPTYPPA